MRSLVPLLTLLTLSIAPQISLADPPEIDGLWKSRSGAVYKFQKEADRLVGMYWILTPQQQGAGFVQGDVAIQGDLIGNVIVATFRARLQLDERDRCPGVWERTSPIYFQLTDDRNEMSGMHLLEHVADDCTIDDRMLEQLVLTRIAKENIGDENNAPKKVRKAKTFSGG